MKGIITLVCFFALHCPGFSQEVYEISCKMGEKTYTGLLVRNKGDIGFIRLRGQNGSVSDFDWKSTRLFDQQSFKTKSPVFYVVGSRDSFLFSQATYFRTISGQPDENITNIRIWFKQNKTTKKYEPFVGTLPFSTSEVPLVGLSPTLTIEKEAQTQQRSLSGPEENKLVKVKMLAGNNFSKTLLKSFFAPEELAGKTAFTVTQLVANRKTQRPSLHLIVVNGGEKLCRDDADKIVEYFRGLTSFLDISFKKTVLRDVEFGVSYLTKTINGLKISPNDIVLFTYSGHGFSFRDDDAHPFPQLALWHGDAKSKDFLYKNTINLEDIYNMILAKKPKFALVMGDCCNSFVEMKRKLIDPSILEPPTQSFPGMKSWNNITASHLLLDNRQSYLVAATEKGQLAGSHKWYGGFFTYNFLDLLESKMTEPPSTKPEWKSIFQQVKTGAYEMSKQYVCDGDVCGQRMISKTGK